MSSEEQHHVALPKLYGAAAYARPPKPIEAPARPIDPDDLPLEVLRTPEEQELAARIVGSPYAPHVGGQPATDGNGQDGGLKGRPFRLSSLANRIFGGS